MKRNGDIKSFFRNYEAKTRKVAAEEQPEPDIDPPPVHSDSEIGIDIDPPPVYSDAEIDIDIDDEAPWQPSPQHPHARSYNIQRLPPDPGERIPISDYDVNDQDEVRRRYIAKNAVQPYAHNFEVKKMYGKNRHFNFVWFENYKWLEYSVKYEAAFCFVCYLFKGKSNGGPKGDAFVKGGWKNWYKPDALDKHEGGINSIHNKAQEKYNLFVAPQPSIDNIMVRVLILKPLCTLLACIPQSLEVLDAIGKDPSQKREWTRIRGVAQAIESFDFVFNLHLMLVILGYTNELSKSLQKRDQDIVNAMALVSLAKSRMQHLRSHGWEEFLAKLTLFCNKHDIQVPLWEDTYEHYGRSRRYYEVQTNDDRYRREVYLGVIDQTIQELDNRFDEVNTELLICMSALNPINSFASYDALKVMRLAEFYPMDMSSTDLIRLEFQLTTFIDDMRQDDRFRNASNIGELSIMLVATKKHVLYDLVYLLIKLILILPVATASVERVFSAMNLVKSKLRTTMSDDRLNDCLVTFIERDVFMKDCLRKEDHSTNCLLRIDNLRFLSSAKIVSICKQLRLGHNQAYERKVY